MKFPPQIKIDVLGYFDVGDKLWFLIGQALLWQSDVLLERVAY
jgi:hypothetical protein